MAIRFFDENLQPTTGVFPVSADGIEATQPVLSPVLSSGWLLPRPLRVSVGPIPGWPTDDSHFWGGDDSVKLQHGGHRLLFNGEQIAVFTGSGREVGSCFWGAMTLRWMVYRRQ